MPGLDGQITNEQIHPHARGYTLGRSAEIDLGADASTTAFLIGMTSPNSRFVVDWVEFLYTETAHNETSTLSLGHYVSLGNLDVDSIAIPKTMLAQAAIKTVVPWTATEFATAVLTTTKTWPGLPVIPAGSAVWVTLAKQSSLNNGKGILTVHGFDWCETD